MLSYGVFAINCNDVTFIKWFIMSFHMTDGLILRVNYEKI